MQLTPEEILCALVKTINEKTNITDNFVELSKRYDKLMAEKKDIEFQELYARNIVDMANNIFAGYRLLELGLHCEHKKAVARIFIEKSEAQLAQLSLPILKQNLSTIQNRNLVIEL